jgi:hypothetical protein
VSNETRNHSPAAPLASLGHLQARFLELLPRIEGHARSRFRHLRCPGRRADAVAETIAVSWRWYVRLSARGRDAAPFVGALALLAARHVRAGRRLCGQEKSKDALSALAQQRHGFAAQALPAHETSGAGNEALDALRDNAVTPPPEQAAFRIDYPAWLARLAQRDRTIAREMALSRSTKELASEHGLSQGRVSQLRRELHASWRRFHGEDSK